jgi:hypothetical protein
MDVMSPVVQAASSHEFLRDWCKKHHPRAHNQRCAFVYQYAKGWEEYNKMLTNEDQHIMDPRNEHNPTDIDLSADEFLEVDGEIYANFDHFRLIHYNLKRDKYNIVMQEQYAKKYKKMKFFEKEAIRDYNRLMQPFIDNLDEYCESHTRTECEERTAQIDQVINQEIERHEALDKKRLKELAATYKFNPCSEESTDCNEYWDEEKRKYLDGSETKKAYKQWL